MFLGFLINCLNFELKKSSVFVVTDLLFVLLVTFRGVLASLMLNLNSSKFTATDWLVALRSQPNFNDRLLDLVSFLLNSNILY